ncbi:Fur family transcriptional regulator [Chryseobacterium turcicum]|uniref:Transcriptional repressor n=1 Tax=Chryseobacterium turcicum TaxID=2898076 RepID=A0A9Q3YV87_9FLAO|nr:transcriptional repressor [Chryseobacterium turcicum]MCD1116608.1 transcriptional repressor [Chryseobacterium turcicum]
MIRRSTPTKDAVLNVLADSKKAMSQEAIMKNIAIDIDRATIYRVLNRFCEDKILHKIVAEDGKQYFAVCIKCEDKKLANHHFHFRCTQCQTIECLPVAVQFSLEKGYQVESVNCILTGVCKDCA